MRLLFSSLMLVLSVPAGTAADQGLPSCQGCHKAQATPQKASLMRRALEPVAQCAILREHPKLTFTEGPYVTTITREGEKSIYQVTNGKDTISVPLLWAFGLGAAGQTYVFEWNGNLYESRVSYYREIKGLDLTMGAQEHNPRNLEEAAGRRMDARGAQECFDCHTTGAVRGGTLHTEALTPGITCEKCHPSADQHLAALKLGKSESAKMPKLSAMSSEETSDFCGRCHRTWETIAMNGPHSINNVRFQPYRLALSKCYDAADKRISCIACHDPHVEVQAVTASYDSRCLACHQVKGSAAAKTAKVKACPVAAKDCASCHMPKLDLPGAHAKFTDHRIRVVRAGERYPD